MNENEIKELFDIATIRRGWYKKTDIKRTTANNYKRQHKEGILPLAKYIEVLLKLGYKIEVTK